jgi:hypothetical protein
MKLLSGLLLPTLAAVLLLACTPTNAAHRGGGPAYDGTWSVAIGSSAAAFIPRTKATNRMALSARMA